MSTGKVLKRIWFLFGVVLFFCSALNVCAEDVGFDFEVSMTGSGYQILHENAYYIVPKVVKSLSGNVEIGKTKGPKVEYELRRFSYRWFVDGKDMGDGGASYTENVEGKKIESLTLSCKVQAWLAEKAKPGKSDNPEFAGPSKSVTVTFTSVTATLGITNDILCVKTDYAKPDTSKVLVTCTVPALEKNFSVKVGSGVDYDDKSRIMTAASSAISDVAILFGSTELDTKPYTVFAPGLEFEKQIVCTEQFTIPLGTRQPSPNNGTMVSGFDWKQDTITLTPKPLKSHSNIWIASLLKLEKDNPADKYDLKRVSGSDSEYFFIANSGTVAPGNWEDKKIQLKRGDDLKTKDKETVVAPVDNWKKVPAEATLCPEEKSRTENWWNHVPDKNLESHPVVIKFNNNCLAFGGNTNDDYFQFEGAQPPPEYGIFGQWNAISISQGKAMLERMKEKGHWSYHVTESVGDYHWYRLEADGQWSEKCGVGMAKDNVTSDPRILRRIYNGGITNYSRDIGFCWVPDYGRLQTVLNKNDKNVSKAYPKGYNGLLGYHGKDLYYIVTNPNTLPKADTTYIPSSNIIIQINGNSHRLVKTSDRPHIDYTKFTGNIKNVSIYILEYTSINESFVYPGYFIDAGVQTVGPMPIEWAKNLGK